MGDTHYLLDIYDLLIMELTKKRDGGGGGYGSNNSTTSRPELLACKVKSFLKERGRQIL